MSNIDIISGALIVAGSLSIVVGLLGVYRMPDFFTRLHAASVIDTLGTILILSNVESIYKWKGKIVSEKEILVVIKTIHSNREKLKKFIRAHHEYENPELIFISIEDGSKEYLKWLEKEIKLK